MTESCRRSSVERTNLRILREHGFEAKLEVETVGQQAARLLQIEWALYDSVPPSINQQIAPYVAFVRFQKDWGYEDDQPRKELLKPKLDQLRLQLAGQVHDETVAAYNIKGDQTDKNVQEPSNLQVQGSQTVTIQNAEVKADQIEIYSSESSESESQIESRRKDAQRREVNPIVSEESKNEVWADDSEVDEQYSLR